MNSFPTDFTFRLTKPDFGDLRSQIVISSRGGRRYPLHPLWIPTCTGGTVRAKGGRTLRSAPTKPFLPA